MYKPERILKGAPNARDLGGIETISGSTLRHNRLIRSGPIWRLEDGDIEYLKKVGLHTVVDFRTLPERLERPDMVIDGVINIACPMLEQKTDGISRDKPLSDDEEAQRTVKMAERLMKLGRNGRDVMKSLYPILVTDAHSVEHYRQFFEIILDNEKGAVLYHCSMGKDRVGTATALILSALGVSRENIVEDYLITRERCAEGTAKLIEDCRKYTDDEEKLRFIYWLDMAEPDFITAALDTIDEVYGSMDEFLSAKMQLNAEKRDKLRELYLE